MTIKQLRVEKQSIHLTHRPISILSLATVLWEKNLYIAINRNNALQGGNNPRLANRINFRLLSQQHKMPPKVPQSQQFRYSVYAIHLRKYGQSLTQQSQA